MNFNQEILTLLDQLQDEMALIKRAITYINLRLRRIADIAPCFDDGVFDEDELHG